MSALIGRGYNQPVVEEDFEIIVASERGQLRTRVSVNDTIGAVRRKLIRATGGSVPGLFRNGAELNAHQTVGECNIGPRSMLTTSARIARSGRKPDNQSRASRGSDAVSSRRRTTASPGQKQDGWWPSALAPRQTSPPTHPPRIEEQRTAYKHLSARHQISHLETQVQQLQWRNAELESTLGLNVDEAERAREIVQKRQIRTPRLPLDLDLFVRTHKSNEAAVSHCPQETVVREGMFIGTMPYS